MASNQNSIVDEDGSHSDQVEIRNPDATPVSLNGWSLTDYKQFRIPNGTTIAAADYLVFNETDFNPNGDARLRARAADLLIAQKQESLAARDRTTCAPI